MSTFPFLNIDAAAASSLVARIPNNVGFMLNYYEAFFAVIKILN